MKNNFQIDPRGVAEIRNEIARLAASYTPEWVFDPKDPDAGSVIALIFANQMADNIRKINRTIEKYRTEFVNLLNLTLRPANPAKGVAVLELIQNTVPGIDVPKGTKLLGMGDGEDARNIVFETCGDVHITNSRLLDIIAVSPHFGKIIPILGTPSIPSITSGTEPEPAPAEQQEEVFPVSLFDYSGPGVQRNVLLLYHQSLFDTAGGVSIAVRALAADTGENLSGLLADPAAYRWSYFAEDGMKEFERVTPDGGAVVLTKTGLNQKVRLEGAEYSLICVEALAPVRKTVNLQSLNISSACRDMDPSFVFDGTQDLDSADFLPFGEVVSVFDECYIGHDDIFRQYGAVVTLRFQLSSREKLVDFTPRQVQDDLKVIKRKPHTVQFAVAETSPQRVAIEYFNGTGWRSLACMQDWSVLFDGGCNTGEQNSEISIRFVCPDDWRPAVTGGYQQRSLRLRVTQADNCYLQPCIHKMPVIKSMKLSYSYSGEWKMPQRLRRICGISAEDITQQLLSRQAFMAFGPLPYAENAILLGFDRKMSGAPVSILFNIQESVPFAGSPIHFEYSTQIGFEQLKVVDHTRNMTAMGTVMFLPPENFAKRKIAGKERYWLRIVDDWGGYNNPDCFRSVIRNIQLNAVEISNEETMPEETFTIDAATPNMEFPLAARNILTAEVFVNEKNRLSLPAMQQMIEETPKDVRVEYDFLGGISEFFVRWTEVDNFDHSNPSDRHYCIDRMTDTIRFGDGVSVMIPGAQRGTALTVRAKCCDGAAGNLPKGAVNSSFSRMLYINHITNPIATYAGSNIESLENAHLRGANIISSKGRLVSEQDFVREARSFSAAIGKVRCVAGQDIAGNLDPRLVTVAVMIRDYAEGSYSFNSIKEALRARLLERSEATFSALLVSEPVYVEISLDIWTETQNMERAFEVQNQLKDLVAAFLDPFTGDSGSGWEIGVLPTKFQLSRLLQSVRCGARASRFVATAQYTDSNGVHQRELSALARSPFMIGVNGTHTVHVTASKA